MNRFLYVLSVLTHFSLGLFLVFALSSGLVVLPAEKVLTVLALIAYPVVVMFEATRFRIVVEI